MSGFDFDFNLELETMRGSGNSSTPEKPKEPPINLSKPNVEPQIRPTQGNSGPVATSSPSQRSAPASAPEPIAESLVLSEPATTVLADEPGLEVQQSREEKLGGGSTQKMNGNPINWKQFKTLPGLFEHVGGDRPVVLHQNIKRVQVSGVPEPMVSIIQELLKKRHLGAVIDFPWGSYRIEATNKVFTTKTSLVRYLLFDSLRDEAGTHVQYAKQWFALQYPTSVYADFKPKRDMNASSDELDVYALLAVAHSAEPERSVVGDSRVGLDREAMERLSMLNTNLDRVLSKLTAQDQMMQENAEHSNMIQTIMLLDRMGMLNGALPRDIGAFIRMLEENRDVIGQTTDAVNNHMEAEQERKKTLIRDERMRQYHNKRRS